MREGQIDPAGEQHFPLTPRLPGRSPEESLFQFLRDKKATAIIHADSEGWHLGLYWFGESGFCESGADGREPEDAARAFLAAQVRERAGFTA